MPELVKHISKLFYLTLLVCTQFVAAEYVPFRPGQGSIACQSDNPLVLTLDINVREQMIKSFGASDCWTIQNVGNWPEEKTTAIADLLFSTELDDNGRPKGIGLSLWRMYLGAGSSRQNNISDPWRRADCFLDEAMAEYDWQRCSGQRNFLQLARSRGVKQFTAFCNSPLINMTCNGFAFCDPSVGTTNLDHAKSGDFARYLADVLVHFLDVEGIDFNFISPVNEPEWDWNQNRANPPRAGQEGCRYSNSDIKKLIDVLYPQLQKAGLKTEIEICESGNIEYLYSKGDANGNHIARFFDKDSDCYIGDKVVSAICGHSYWTDTAAEIVDKRQKLRTELDKYSLDFVQSEYSILGDRGEIKGNRRDLGIDPALWLARVIHTDLTVANAISWQWWTAVSPVNYKDGLVYCDRNTTDGNFYQSKMLWAMGNFSRFVRPGMYRIPITRSDNKTEEQAVNGLMVSGYFSTEDKVAVVVLVNSGKEDQPVRIDIIGQKPLGWVPFVTSGNDIEKDSLTPYDTAEPGSIINIPGRSVVTIVSDLE